MFSKQKHSIFSLIPVLNYMGYDLFNYLKNKNKRYWQQKGVQNMVTKGRQASSLIGLRYCDFVPLFDLKSNPWTYYWQHFGSLCLRVFSKNHWRCSSTYMSDEKPRDHQDFEMSITIIWYWSGEECDFITRNYLCFCVLLLHNNCRLSNVIIAWEKNKRLYKQ